jgi:hypothetical protein
MEQEGQQAHGHDRIDQLGARVGRHKARGRRRLLHPQQRPQKETLRPDHGQDQHDQELVLELKVFLALLKLGGTKNELLERRHGVNPRAPRRGAGL